VHRVLILSTDAGYAHTSCVRGLREIAADIPDLQVDCLEVFRDIAPEDDFFKKLSGINGVDIYNDLVLGRSWSTLFWPVFALAIMLHIICKSRVAAAKLASVLDAYDPDVVISVAPFVNAAIAKGIRQHSRKVPFLTVMVDSDEVFPRTWMQDRDQIILVSTERGYARLTRNWPNSKVLRMQGLPISRDFSIAKESHTKSTAQKLLGLKPDRPVLIMSFGGRGTNRICEYASAIDEKLLGIQSMYLCGTNKHIIDTLKTQKRAAISEGMCHVFGLRQDVPVLLRASDIFVGKPGPFSVYECMEMGVPMLLELNRKTMLQERYNAKMVQEYGYGTIFRSASQLRKLLQEFTAGRMTFKQANTSSSSARNQIGNLLTWALDESGFSRSVEKPERSVGSLQPDGDLG
jgi:1,2-diacylglycerol 3-beta-galactosyltransferase